jgi:hypothetical protein
MNNTASLLILHFLAITFIISCHEKIFHWKEAMSWMIPHFEKTILKNFVPYATGILLVVELIAAIFSVIGCIQLYINGGREFGYYGAVFSCISLLMMLIGQRLAKDYEGAKTIAIYFVPAVLGVFLLS